MATYIIVDINNLFHRAKHAVTGDAALKAGSALYIFFNSVKKLWNEHNATHVVITSDKGSWRKTAYPEYKANREVLKALRKQSEIEEDKFVFDTMYRLLDYAKTKTNMTVLEETDCEADDFIARWIQIHPDDQHIILSSDTDFYQLLADNVKIYDGMKNILISTTEVLNENGKPAEKKKKIKEKFINKKGEKKVIIKEVKEKITPPDPEYELFKKIIRGDSTDNILSAKPGAREKGSATKPGIKEAYNDRQGRGYDWTLFMQDEWEDHNGNMVKVIDAYNFNKHLIDLTDQPSYIKERMDEAFAKEATKDKVKNIGIWFLKFCNEMDLVRISQSPNEYIGFIQAPYMED